MKHSIYFRNFLTTAGIVLASFFILGSVFFVWSYRLVMSEKRETMMATANEVEKTISAFSWEWELEGFVVRITLSAVSNTTGFDIIVVDTDGVVISCSDSEIIICEHIGKTVPQDVLSVLNAGSSFSKNTNLGGVYNEKRYVVGLPLTQEIPGNKERIIGYVFLSSESETMAEIWRQFTGIFILISMIVLFLTFFISLITTKKQAEPINEMARAAHRFARGDFTVRVENPCRQDEIGELTDAFNTMADSLERSEKLRREFIANVSHELKTPMTIISGFSDGILDGTIPQESQRKYLEVISSETRRLSRLVRSMLDMSHIQSTDAAVLLRSSFDISEVIRLALLSLGSKIDAKGLDVEAELPEEPVKTRGDKDSITQVVYNLIDNAIKFAEQGSVIKLSLWKQSGKAYVSVENRGETIPEEEMPLIFDRFHKTDRSRSENRDGVGLGLYIVKTILDNHNEDIFVTSVNGITKFVFTLTIAGTKHQDNKENMQRQQENN
jgi:signal transduction histidine kinase